MIAQEHSGSVTSAKSALARVAYARYGRSHTQEEVARILGCTRQAVQQTERRALRKLYEKLAHIGYERLIA